MNKTQEPNTLIDLRLTEKQKRFLDILDNWDYKDKTMEEKCQMAGIDKTYGYRLMVSPRFIKALRLRNMTSVLVESPSVVKRVLKDAKDGQFMQQRMSLEMSGDYQQRTQPLVNIILNTDVAPDDNIDSKITQHIIDILPEVSVAQEDNAT